MRVVPLLALFSGAALAAPVDDMLRWAERLEQQGLEQLALMEWETLVQSEDLSVRTTALTAMLRAEHPNPLALRAAILSVPEEQLDRSVRSIAAYERAWAYLERDERSLARQSFNYVSSKTDEELYLRALLGEAVVWLDRCGTYKRTLSHRNHNFRQANLPEDLLQTLFDLQTLLAARSVAFVYSRDDLAIALAREVSQDGRYASEALVFIAATQREVRTARYPETIPPDVLLTDLQLYGVGPDEARQPPSEAFAGARWLGDDPDAVDLALVYAADRLDAGDCDAVIQVAEGVQARWGETWRDLQQLTLTDPSRAWRGRGELEPAVLARLMEPRDLTRLEAAMEAIPAELLLVLKHSPDPFVDSGKLYDRRLSLQRGAATVLQDEASAMARRLEHVGAELGVAWAEALVRAEAGTCVIPPRP